MRILLLLLLLPACANTLRDKVYGVSEKAFNMPYMISYDNRVRTPEEFWKNGGNCKDYVEAEYQEFHKIGVKDSEMTFWLIILDPTGRKSHAMLEVDGYVIDSNTRTVMPKALMSVYGDNNTEWHKYNRKEWLHLWHKLNPINKEQL